MKVAHIEQQILRLTSPIPPSVNHYLGYRAVIKGRRAIATSYKTTIAKQYQKEFIEYVEQEVMRQGWVKSKNRFQHYYMDCVFYFPRIDMDANNFFKCLADSITDSGLVWIDDTQLCERVNQILYDTENPRIEIEIAPVDYIGIFKNISQLDTFKSNCIQCTRYKNGKCRILSDSVIGKIRPEINNTKCLKEKCSGK